MCEANEMTLCFSLFCSCVVWLSERRRAFCACLAHTLECPEAGHTHTDENPLRARAQPARNTSATRAIPALAQPVLHTSIKRSSARKPPNTLGAASPHASHARSRGKQRAQTASRETSSSGHPQKRSIRAVERALACVVTPNQLPASLADTCELESSR